MRLIAAVLGLLLGLGLGLFYSLRVDPVKYTDLAPSALRADYKAAWIRLAASAFVVDGDLERARARIASLGEADPAQAVTALAQQMAASGGDPAAGQALASLAAALGGGPLAVTPVAEITLPPTFTPLASVEPSPAVPPTATPILLPTRPPSPTPPGSFVLVSTQVFCDSKLPAPLVQVVAQDALGNGVPGVEVIVEWAGGQDRFFTGLKPELGAGYGDFAMERGVDYTIRLTSDLSGEYAVRSDPCSDETGQTTATSVTLLFQQP